jgi:hypothetical protein
MEIKKHQCVACGGEHLCFGYIGPVKNVFIPSGLFTIAGFRIRSFVCLDCGHVSQYMSAETVKKLKNKFRTELGATPVQV